MSQPSVKLPVWFRLGLAAVAGCVVGSATAFTYALARFAVVGFPDHYPAPGLLDHLDVKLVAAAATFAVVLRVAAVLRAE